MEASLKRCAESATVWRYSHEEKIFQAMMAAAGSVLLASLIIILGCLYDYFDGLQEKQMQDELTLAAAADPRKADKLIWTI